MLKEEYVASQETLIINVIPEVLSQMNIRGLKPFRYLKFPFPPNPAKLLTTHPCLGNGTHCKYQVFECTKLCIV
jgi:hypothetical protein